MIGLLAAAVLTVQLVCGNLGVERRFLTQALHFTDRGDTIDGGVRVARLTLGRERVELLHYGAAGAPIPTSARSNDRNFQHIAVIVSDMRRAWAHVRRFHIRQVSTAPQVLPESNPAAGGIAAVYFRDPEGHPLELLHFPGGKGAPRWHASAPLFLGIDHTAIVVADTAKSSRFYEALGLVVRGHSNNFGVEQDRLSGVPGAHVMITAMGFAGAPGVEFLQYVNPLRRQTPETAGLTDLVATRTRFVRDDAEVICKRFPIVSKKSGGCIVRDPDGHFVEIDTR